MNNLEKDCERLIDYLGDQINEDSVQFIKNTFANIEKEQQSNSIYPQFKRVGDFEISEGGLSKLDYFAGKALGVIDFSLVETFGSESVSQQVYDIAEAMVEESMKRQLNIE
jgi:hypothetical protein